MKANTFGDYQFEEWVPERTRKLIRDFWGTFGRTHDDWLESPRKQGLSEFSHHGPSLNGFQMPPNGAVVEFFIEDHKASREQGKSLFEVVRGRYIHRWNNMGSLIDFSGVDHTVSTCDRWVRCFVSVQEKKAAGLETNRADVYMEKLI